MSKTERNRPGKSKGELSDAPSSSGTSRVTFIGLTPVQSQDKRSKTPSPKASPTQSRSNQNDEGIRNRGSSKLASSPGVSPRPSIVGVASDVPEDASTYNPMLVPVLTMVIAFLAICIAGSLLGLWLVISELFNLQRVQKEREAIIKAGTNCEMKEGYYNCNNVTLMERIANITKDFTEQAEIMRNYSVRRDEQLERIKELQKQVQNETEELKAAKAEAARAKRETANTNPMKKETINNKLLKRQAINNDTYRFIQKSMSTPVFFTAVVSKSHSIDYGKKVQFDNVITNEGDGFKISSFDFHAPAAGIYLFKLHIMTLPNTACKLKMEKNGKRMVSVYAVRQLYEQTVSNAVVMQLEKDDVVDVKTSPTDEKSGISAGGTFYTDGFQIPVLNPTTFTGVILYEFGKVLTEI